MRRHQWRRRKKICNFDTGSRLFAAVSAAWCFLEWRSRNPFVENTLEPVLKKAFFLRHYYGTKISWSVCSLLVFGLFNIGEYSLEQPVWGHVCSWLCSRKVKKNTLAGNTKGRSERGSITVWLTFCLTGLESAVWLLTFFLFICNTD